MRVIKAAFASAPGPRSARRFAACALCLVLGATALPLTATGGQDSAPRFVDSRPITVADEGLREPSGLALAADGRHFWTVSDNASRIFLVGLDGALKHSATIDIDLSGPEGIVEDWPRRRLLVANENTSEIVEIDLKSGKTRRVRLAGLPGYVGNGLLLTRWRLNNGIEGITVDPATGSVFVIKEKSPRLLLQLAPDLSRIVGVTKLTAAMGFVDDRVGDDRLDLSDITYDPRRGVFWMTSDTGKRLFRYDPVRRQAQGWPLLLGDGRSRLANAEGLALGPDGTTIHVVSDDRKASRLVSYALD